MNGFEERSCALVVGGRRGVGRAIADRLEASGAFERVWRSSRTWGADDNAGDRLTMDVTSEDSVAGALSELGDAVASAGNPAALRLVVNCAGLLHGDGAAPEKRVRDITPSGVEAAFSVNALGHMLVAKHALPLLPRKGRVVYAGLSARVGSIGDNRLGGWHAYRTSKAAQNMFMKGFSIELRRHNRDSVCASLHPGTVKTDLSEPFRAGVPADKLFEANFAAESLLGVIDGLTPADTGCFRAWDAAPIAW